MKLIEHFRSFVRDEVDLNQARLDRLQERVEAIESFIAASGTFEDLFLDVIPAGSWAHRTIIRPVTDADEFDADVLLYLKEHPDWLPRDYIEKLHGTFRDSGVYRDLAKRRTRCVRVDYAGDFHIDVVPYLARGGASYITNRREPEGIGRWEPSDPEAFTNWIDERQRLTNGTFIKVVRLAKYLRDFKNTFTCKSIILTTLLGNAVNELEASVSPERYADISSTFVTLLSRLASTLPEQMPAVMDPAGTGDDFAARYRAEWDYPNFRTRIITYATKAKAALDEPDRDASMRLWQEILGEAFGSTSLEESKAVSLRASVPWGGEQFIDRPPYGHPIRLQGGSRVWISGRCSGLWTAAGYRRNGFREFDLSSNGSRVPKDRRLQFRARTNVTMPYELYWKVRNGGEEAAARGELRGEITRDGGEQFKLEHTSFKGTHYVECYVVKDGFVVARNRQAVVVT